MITKIVPLVSILAWFGLWGLGGWGLTRKAFKLSRRDEFLIGLGIGFVVETWLSNLLGRFLPPTAGFWLSAGLVFLVGLAANLINRQPTKKWFPIPINFWQLFSLIALTAMFTAVGRGLAIFDDYQNLPLTSQLATGDIPPRFSFNPQVRYDYHYFLILFAAQVMRLAQSTPWFSIDLARGLALAFSGIYAGMLARRLTKSSLAGWLGSLVFLFSGGIRWVFLLMPPGFVAQISAQITLIDSGKHTAPDLAAALVRPWAIHGTGPFEFPFAFISGINIPSVLIHNGSGVVRSVLLILALLTFDRWKNKWAAAALSGIMLAAFGLAFETNVLFLTLAWLALAVYIAIRNKKLALPAALWGWLGLNLAAGIVILVQGGVFSGIFIDFIERITGNAAEAYHTFQFSIALPPQVISRHLGTLILTRPIGLLSAFLEIGPVILVLPLVIGRLKTAYTQQHWFETSFILAGLLSIFSIFVQYGGVGIGGVGDAIRLYFPILHVCTLYAVPLTWNWVKTGGEKLQTTAGVLGLTSLMGGLVSFGIAMIAAQQPVISYFMTELDAIMFDRHWDQLEADALVFDPAPGRAVTVLGRYTDSSENWWVNKESWLALKASPNPYDLQAAGYDYALIDRGYVEQLDPEYREAFDDVCIIEIDSVSVTGPKDYRRLLDLRGCR